MASSIALLGTTIDNTHIPIRVDAAGNMETAINGYIRVQRGDVPGQLIINKFSRNPDVDAAEDVWYSGGDYTGWPSAYEKLELVSDSIADTSDGTGARTVRVYGLDENFNMVDEVITLNGTTPVDTVYTYSRVYRAIVVTAGSGTTNAGNILIRHTTTTANLFSTIPAGLGQTFQSNFTIPAGYTGFMMHYDAQVLDANANRATIGIKYRELNSAVRIQRIFHATNTQNFRDEVYGGLKMPAKTDFIFRVLTVSSANADITVTWDMILVAND